MIFYALLILMVALGFAALTLGVIAVVQRCKEAKKAWPPVFHVHRCPQCHELWECAAQDCKDVLQAWCPAGDLCHIKLGETAEAHTIPTRRRKSSGDGALFHEKKS